jgi:hypothetical protein
MTATIAFCRSRASFNIACARRAKVRNATTVLAVSTSQAACTRSLAAVLSIAASFWPRKRARMGSGAAITRHNFDGLPLRSYLVVMASREASQVWEAVRSEPK